MNKPHTEHFSEPSKGQIKDLIGTVLRFLASGFALALALAGVCYANDLEGTWRLTMRKLPDGTALTPPTVQGLVTFSKGVEQTIVFWRTPDGKSASLSQIDKIEVTETEFIATPVLVIFDDGSGTLPTYTVGGETKRARISKQSGRISYQHPTHPPFVVVEGNTFTATVEGAFVDHWEKLK
jgi:hypothetical protein